MSKRLIGGIIGCKYKAFWHLNGFPDDSNIGLQYWVTVFFLRKIRTRLDLLSIPQSGGKMSKRLGGIIACKNKTSSWHLNGFPGGSNIGSMV